MLQRILLIDDSEGEALFVKQMLRNAGLTDPIYYLQEAEEAIRYMNGDEQYENREKFPLPDIILLDLAMPGCNGYDFLRWLRSQADLARVVVIVLTAEMDPKRIQLAYQLGATSFLSKNASAEEYHNFVEFFRGFSRVANTLPRSSPPANTITGPRPALPGPDQDAGSAGQNIACG